MLLSRFTIILTLTALLFAEVELRADDFKFSFLQPAGRVSLRSQPGRVSLRLEPGRVVIRAQSFEEDRTFVSGNKFLTNIDSGDDFQSSIRSVNNFEISQTTIQDSAYTEEYDPHYNISELKLGYEDLDPSSVFCPSCLSTDDDESTRWGRLKIKIRDLRMNTYLWSRKNNRKLLNPVCSPVCHPNYGYHQTRWRTFPPLVCDPPPAAGYQSLPPEPVTALQSDSFPALR